MDLLLYSPYLSSGEYLGGSAETVLPPQSGHSSLVEYFPQSLHLLSEDLMRITSSRA